MSGVLSGERLRGLAWQALVLGGALALALWLVDNTLENLARRGIVSGFGFLDHAAGFTVTQSLIPFDASSSYGRAFLVGLLNTLLVSALGIALATVAGFLIGAAMLSTNWLVARLAVGYVELVRNVPLLLQLFFWYFAVLRSLPPPRASLALGGGVFLNNRGLYLPAPEASATAAWLLGAAFALLAAMLVLWFAGRRRAALGALGLAGLTAAASVFGLRWDVPALRGFNFVGGVSLIPELVALVTALSAYTAAFIAEIVRGGILSVDRGQVEAARALGLSAGQTLRLVVLPQALRVIVPPLTNQYLNLTKNSSLAAAIAYPDLVSVFAGTVLNQTGQAIEVIALTMAVYLAISLAIALAMNLYNRRVLAPGGGR